MSSIKIPQGRLGFPLMVALLSASCFSGCLPRKTESSDTAAFGRGSEGGYLSAVIGNIKGRMVNKTKDKLWQLATDADTQAEMSYRVCKQFKDLTKQEKCFQRLVATGKVITGVTKATTVEVKEAVEAVEGVFNDPESVAEGVLIFGEEVHQKGLKNKAMEYKDEAVACALAVREHYKKGEYDKASEILTHAGLLVVPVGKALKGVKAAEEATLAARAAEVAARLKIAKDISKGSCQLVSDEGDEIQSVFVVENDDELVAAY